VAVFASRFAGRVLERSTFYLVPLVLIALLVWIERGAPRPRRATLVAAVVAAALPGALPFSRLIHDQSISDTLMFLPLEYLQEHGIRLAELSTLVVPASIGAALLLLLPQRRLFVVPLFVLAYFAAALVAVEARIGEVSEGALSSGISGDRAWVDRALPAGARAAVLWTEDGDVYDVWQNEFFNRGIGTIYSVAGPLPGGLSHVELTVDAQAGVLRGPDGAEVGPAYLVADDSFTPAGRVLARDERQGLTLYELAGPLRSAVEIAGLYPGDTWSGAQATYTRRDCRGGVLAVQLRSDPSLFTTPQTVVATVAGAVAGRVTFDPGSQTELVLPLTPRDGTCVVDFSVSPTAVPAEVTLGRNPDTRVLGVHFDRFDYTAP
jgi:hypothetical protein